MQKAKYGRYIGAHYGNWRVIRYIDSGGNGDVFEATFGNDHRAIKLIKRKVYEDQASYRRFSNEVEGMRICGDIPGVLPLIEWNVPPKPSQKEQPWIVMPLAKTIRDELGQTPKIDRVVTAFRDIGKAILEMHQRGITHRDIKPDNLFHYEGKWVVGDLGLIKFDHKREFTIPGRRLGPYYFMAPEMLAGRENADGRAADVYALAKSLWALGSMNLHPLPGHMIVTIPAFCLSNWIVDERCKSLDLLIMSATDPVPANRPTTHEFVNRLDLWLQPKKIVADNSVSMDLSDLAGDASTSNAIHALRTQELERLMEIKREARDEIVNAFRNFGLTELSAAFESAGLADCGDTAQGGDFGVKGMLWGNEIHHTLIFGLMVEDHPGDQFTIRCRYWVQDTKGKTNNIWNHEAMVHAMSPGIDNTILDLFDLIRAQTRYAVTQLLHSARQNGSLTELS